MENKHFRCEKSQLLRRDAPNLNGYRSETEPDIRTYTRSIKVPDLESDAGKLLLWFK